MIPGSDSEILLSNDAKHVSRKMMEHYSHIRMEAKRKAVDGLTPVTAVEREASPDEMRVN